MGDDRSNYKEGSSFVGRVELDDERPGGSVLLVLLAADGVVGCWLRLLSGEFAGDSRLLSKTAFCSAGWDFGERLAGWLNAQL